MTFAQKPGSFQLLLKAVSDCEQSQVPLVLSGAQYMDIAAQLEIHTKQELEHALTLSRRSTIWAKCQPSHPSQCAHRRIRKTCSGSISTMRMKPFAITAIASGNVKRLENTRWQNKFGKFSCKSKTIKIDLATALGIEVPDISGGPKGRRIS
jgi:hypothetical protein